MAFTFRGIGAMHYGRRDFQPDGSYVTTLWFVCLYLPIVPIQSKRIRPTGEVTYYALRPRRKLLLLEKTRPNLTQVLSVYAWFAAELASFIAAKLLEAWWIAIPGVLLLGLPWLLRRRAMDRVRAQSERMAMGLSPELSE
jgi:hypothetical protein